MIAQRRRDRKRGRLRPWFSEVGVARRAAVPAGEPAKLP